MRPTTDFAREALFNIIENRLNWPETSVLDLFAGSGALGVEALSRGAREVWAVEQNPRVYKWLNAMKREQNLSAYQPLRIDALRWLDKSVQKFQVVLADPPFDFQHYHLLVDLVLKNALDRGGLFVLEHRKKTPVPTALPQYLEQRHYGEVGFTFYES